MIYYIEKMIHYICIIPILLCCSSIFHLGLKFELKYSLLHLKIKFLSQYNFLLQKSLLGCSKLCSGPEIRLHPIDQSECNIFSQNLSISNQNVLVQTSTFFLIGMFINQWMCCTNELDQHQINTYCLHGT